MFEEPLLTQRDAMKTTNKILTVACVGLIAIQVASSAAESMSVLLQKGIFAEETEGDLEAAIRI